MPRFVSVAGKWNPAKETVQLPLSHEDLVNGKSPVYTGPDRGALSLMVEQGYAVEDKEGPIHYCGEDERYIGKRFKIVDYPGRDCFTDPDLIRMARTLGYKSVAEYLEEMFGINKKDIQAKAKELVGVIKPHEDSASPKPDLEILAGGEDRSGQGHHRRGGFGDPNDVPAGALKQRA